MSDIKKNGTIDDVFTVVSGTTPSTSVPEYWENGAVIWVTPADLSNVNEHHFIESSERLISEIALAKTGVNLVPKNTIIMSTRAPVGTLALAKKPLTFNQGCHGLVNRDESRFDTMFYYFYLLSKQSELQNQSGGSTFKELSVKRLKDFPVPIIPLHEQKRIASTLSAVDKAIEQAGIAIEESERMKRGLMKKLLDDMCISSGVCNANKSKLGEVVSLRKDQVSPLECLGMKFVGLEHLIPGQQEVLNYGIIDDQRSLKSRFFEGDVLYGKLRPYLDKGGLASFDGCCSTDILVLIADTNKTIPEFISIIIHKTDFIAYAMAHKNGTNHPRTSWNALANYEFNLPSIENQKRIVNVLKNAELLTISFTRRKFLLETLKRGMMQQLLSGANMS